MLSRTILPTTGLICRRGFTENFARTGFNSKLLRRFCEISEKRTIDWDRKSRITKQELLNLNVKKHPDRELYYLHDPDGNPLSFWHSVPRKLEGVAEYQYNCVVEIPHNRLAKLEMSKEITSNPIVQDKKKHPLTGEKVDRYYYIFPPFTYGFIPQTYESPKPDPAVNNLLGDSDPIDVVEVSGWQTAPGQIIQVNVFGCLPLVDQGEIDYKILAIRVDHPLAVNDWFWLQDKITNLKDFQTLFPEKLDYISNWFLRYKTYEGKPMKNYYLKLKNDHMSREDTLKTIEHTHQSWLDEIKANNYAAPDK